MNDEVILRLQNLLNVWNKQYVILTDDLYSLGDKSSSIEYNILSARALQLSDCINSLKTMMLNHLLGVEDE